MHEHIFKECMFLGFINDTYSAQAIPLNEIWVVTSTDGAVTLGDITSTPSLNNTFIPVLGGQAVTGKICGYKLRLP